MNRYIASCSVEEILFSMPLLEKLESSGRRSDVLSHPDCTLERVKKYLTYPSAQIRKHALAYQYECLKDSWPGLESMLLDSSRGV